MLGEPANQFSLTREALSTRGAHKQIPMCELTFLAGKIVYQTE